MAKRRGHGEGAIYKRRSDGRWVGSITVGRTSAGIQKRRIVYGQTKQQVLARLREAQNLHMAGALADPSNLTVADWLTHWTETVGKTKRISTQERRRVYIEKHINPFIGSLRLNKLQLAHLESWLLTLEREGRSNWTRHQAATTLGTALRRAVKVKLIPFNPSADLSKPRLEHKEIAVLTEDETRLLLRAAIGHRLRAIFVLAVTSGMRQGEILGLHWTEVDFAGASVKVIRTPKESKGGGFSLEPPKSRRSIRRIDLPRVALDALNEHRKAMLAESRDVKTGPVFVTSTGNYIGRSNFVRQTLRPLVDRANKLEASKTTNGLAASTKTATQLPQIKFHMLRHTHASTLLARGRNIREVAERLGHSNPELTLRVYAHLMPGMGKETAAVLDQLFGT